MTPNAKSPFLVFENFISPHVCEQVVDLLNFTAPDVDKDGREKRTAHGSDYGDDLLYPLIKQILPSIEHHYDVRYRGVEYGSYEWIPRGSEYEPHAENAIYSGKKWARVYNRDITAVLFLSDYNEHADFDAEFEVYGGKLEFPQWGFGFNPVRGTLVTFPSVPNFINNSTRVQVGNLFQARFHIATQKPFLFHRDQFPGTYTDWF